MRWRNFRSGNHHHFHPLEKLRIMEFGAEYFPALELAIATAKKTIYLEVYIFADDPVGRRISAALCSAAKRGIDVKVIVDWVGSSRTIDQFAWNSAGIQFEFYNPKWLGPFGLSRTHRKIVAIDHQRAFVGGINICDDCLDVSGRKLQNPRWDFAVEMRGELALEVAKTFEWQWERSKPNHFFTPLIREIKSESKFPWNSLMQIKAPSIAHESVGAFIARDNLHHRRDIERAYLKAIGAANQEIYLVSAYFLPGHRLRTALTSAAKRGVRVNLLVGTGEFKWLDAALSALYGALLNSGVHIYEYLADQLHAKLLIADGQWMTIGSSNCDPLSFLVNHEANLIVIDKTYASWLVERVDTAIQMRSKKVDVKKYLQRSIWKKTIQWLAYIVSRVMTRLLIFSIHKPIKSEK